MGRTILGVSGLLCIITTLAYLLLFGMGKLPVVEDKELNSDLSAVLFLIGIVGVVMVSCAAWMDLETRRISNWGKSHSSRTNEEKKS